MIRHKITIIPLTAIHVGTGTELGPLEYLIDINKAGNKKMFRFSSEKIANLLQKDDERNFEKAVDNDDMIELRKLFRRYLNNKTFCYSLPVSSEVYNAYKEKINDADNQLLIHEMYRNGRKLNPVIPGSSLKGAVRTAVLNHLAKDANNILSREKDSKKLEAKLLNFDPSRLTDDPFRAVHISDGTVKGNKSQIVMKIYNYRPNKEPKYLDKMQIFSETVRGDICGGDARIYFDLSVDEKAIKLNKIRTKINKALLIESCHEFYTDILNTEYQDFYAFEESIGSSLVQMSGFINKEIDANENATLLRVGRYSQRESMVIHKYAEETQAKSRMVAGYNGAFLPLGWCLMYID